MIHDGDNGCLNIALYFTEFMWVRGWQCIEESVIIDSCALSDAKLFCQNISKKISN